MKDSYLTAVFYRMAARRGMKKAAMAVAHKILVIAYSVIRDQIEYRDAGGDYFDRRNPERTAHRLAQRLARLGYQVTPNAAPSKPGPGRPPGRQKRLPIPLEQASGCARCAGWGVPCIHARNAPPRLAPPDISNSQH